MGAGPYRQYAIDFSWTESDTVTGFTLHLNDGRSLSVSASSRSYRVSVSSPGTNLCGTVTASNNYGTSGNSSQACATSDCWSSPGAGVTFYSGANYTGTAWNDPVRDPYDNSHVFNLSSVNPSANRHLGSFKIDPVGHWHVVLYWGPDGSGNLVHFETSQPNLDSTDMSSTQSVKAYILSASGSCYAY